MNLKLWTHCRIATLRPDAPQPFGLIDDAALVVEGEQLRWVGPRSELPADLRDLCTQTHDAGGALITPGLIDCHTHLVYGGDRAHEFELRLNGATYEDIARQGGGIASTVRDTRAASPSELIRQSQVRLRQLMGEGVTTLEVKSGYGLALEQERKCLQVARNLGQTNAVDVCTTFLGAHALPAEFAGRQDDYVDEVLRMLPAFHAEGLVDAVDAFCEYIAFSPAQVARVFEAARQLGLPVKLHADQLSDGGGAALAARYGALSADHIEHSSEAGVRAMAEAGVVAVLLPGAYLMLRETTPPPIALLRQYGAAMAVATDCNPGTSPLASMTAAINLACVQFRLTPEEALAGATRIAARALGLEAEIGTLAAGKAADLAVWDIARPAELAYWLGKPLLARRMVGGIWDA